mgnify:CR=1 FL=1
MLNCILCFQHVIGSILSGPGSGPGPQASPTAWMDMVDGFQKAALSTRLGIPLMYGIDAVHGHNNVYGSTIFPHNVGLGSTRRVRDYLNYNCVVFVCIYVCNFYGFEIVCAYVHGNVFCNVHVHDHLV